MKKKVRDSERFSVITQDMEHCYNCGAFGKTELHEIFFGARRGTSKVYGMVVPLCRGCHQGNDGVHGKNGKELDTWLKKKGQEVFERVYPDEDFLAIFGKRYL